MTNYRQTMSQALEYMHFVKETNVLERELTDKELKRREEIAKDLDDQEFKDRYGKDWMQVKMGTATKMAKAEDLDEKADVSLKKKAEKSGISASILKQVYNRGVAAWRTGHRPGTTPEQWGHARVNSFISKSSGTWGGSDKDLAAKARGQKEEVELDESVIDKVKQVASKKQAMKIDGVTVDTFTASAISQIYDKVNDANKKKMEKLPITKLASLAMKMMQKSEFVPEGKMQDVWQKKNAKSLSVGPFELIRGKGGVSTIKRSGKVIGDFSYDDEADNFVANIKGMRGQWVGDDIDSLFTHLQKVHKEEVELDESEFSAMAYGKKDQRFVVKPRDTKGMKGKQDKFKMYVVKLDNKGNEREIIKDLGTHVSIDRAIGFAKNRGIIEKVELDEAKFGDKKALAKKGAKISRVQAIMKGKQKPYKEEEDLDEGKMKDLLIKGQDLEAYAKKHGGIDKKDMMKVAAMLKKGDKSGALKYTMKLDTDPKEYILSLMGEIGESAAADARRAMRRDPEMRQKGFSKDISATDDDEKAASKNIMMQMRKAQSLNGRFDVEFQDGKKVKIPAKVAIAVQQKYNAMRRPAEKEKFQSKVAKSYKDMLRALKEGFASDAQRRAAFASGYKEKGKKNKKESILDRIDNKLKERKNG